MVTTVIVQFFGGLGLFLFGMKIMSEGLQKVAGKKMRHILGMVSNNRFIGCAVGTFLTSIVQSSSAVTVLLVGFVDAGLIPFVQAMGVILGANIGTTVTAQLIAFNITEYALPAIAAGVLLKFFLGRQKWVYIGDVLLGFGLLFYGLTTMKTGFAPLKQDPAFIAFFTKFNADDLGSRLLCIMVGTTMTMILQSSSATVGITMALASQGLLNFESSVALVLGDNIGTTITAELASLKANINAKRTARAHTLFNLVGVFYITLFFPLFITLVGWLTSFLGRIGPPDLMVGGQKPNLARYIANAHTTFNVVNALFFLFFLSYLAKVTIWLTPQKKRVKESDRISHIKYIDLRFIDTPSIALEQASAEIIRMAEDVQRMFDDVIHSLHERTIKKLSEWKKQEDAFDMLRKEITQFLVRVMQGHISPEESKEVRSFIRLVNNLERIGDATEDIAEFIEQIIERDLFLSEEALKDYDEISREVQDFLSLVVEAMKKGNKEIMSRAWVRESAINRLDESMKENHLSRLQKGVCTVDAGLVFVNILTAFEKIGGFCYNISQTVAGLK